MLGLKGRLYTFLTPADGFLERLSYRGSLLRGVIALVGYDAAGNIPPTIFVDLRQVAGASQFMNLTDFRLTHEQLVRLAPVPPPRGWRLVVSGGQHRRGYVKVQAGDTLILGFMPEEDVLSELDISSTSEGEDDDDGNEEGEEEGEEEDGSSHPSCASTRSRSRSREAPKASSPTSGDHSYEPGIPQSRCVAVWHDPALPLPQTCSSLSPSADGDVISALQRVASPIHVGACDDIDARGLCLPTHCLEVEGKLQVAADQVPSSTWRTPDWPGLRVSISGRIGAAEDTLLGVEGITFRDPGRPPAPNFTVDHTEQIVPQPRPQVQALIVILVPGYKPDAVTLNLQMPAHVVEVLREVQPLRQPQLREYFPHLIVVPHQVSRVLCSPYCGPCLAERGGRSSLRVQISGVHTLCGKGPGCDYEGRFA